FMDIREIVIRRETEAARLLLTGMRDTIGEEDMALLADTLEGETNLFEAIDTALAEIDETEALISGLKEKEKQFSARRKAMAERGGKPWCSSPLQRTRRRTAHSASGKYRFFGQSASAAPARPAPPHHRQRLLARRV